MKQLQYLNKFFWKYRLRLVFGIIFIIISNVFALYPAEFVREAFDTVLEEKKQISSNISSVLLKYGFLIALFAIMKGVFMFFMRQTIIVMSRKIEFDLKNEIYQQYQKLCFNFYKKNKTGDLMNRISEDVSRVRMYLGPAVMYSINIIILFYLVISKMLTINTTLTLYTLLPLPFLAILVYTVSSNINKKSELVQKQLSTLTTIAQESFSGIKVIKAFNSENTTSLSFLQSCKEYTQRQLNLVKIEAFFYPSILTMIGISTVLIIYVGGIESYKNNISTGNIAEFIIYVNMLAWPVASIGWVTSIIQRAAASQERINNFLQVDEKIKNYSLYSKKVNGEILFKNVFFKYENTNIQALKNITFTINEGETLGIIGKTGSGKSTIAHLVCRLYDIEKGMIKIGGIDIKKLNLNNLRSSIGYVPQDGYLFSGSIKDNISFSNTNTNKNRVIESSKKAKLYTDIKKFNNGFETLIGERGVKLSGGQKQRLSIARVFYKQPDIFIFDDCLSSVDAVKENEIIKSLSQESNKKTTIIISHRIASIKRADKIIYIDDGEIIEQGTHIELIKNKGPYFKLEKQQNKKIND
ncbi:MAG: ABC transporter [Flavobacteriales bacterium]|nr:ABC transporter [Flavobacteriales bacterium]|tara:strand:- start:34053 stop:35798 length:1746 start_codon:yes stop_codon:yes gene_type:complete